MEQANGHHPTAGGTPPAEARTEGAGTRQESHPRLLILIRHGQTTFNVEGKHPGQLPGVPLTDEGRRQAHAAAVALSALPISAVIASPLERARETAEIIARGWGLPVCLEGRLKDTDVGPFAGKTLADLKNNAEWRQFEEHLDQPPPGVEGLNDVAARAVAATRDILRDESLGPYVVVVAHADIVKLILGHYLGIAVESARHIGVANASLSALLFRDPEQAPEVLALNWSPLPHWLHAPIPSRTEAPASALDATPASAEAGEETPATSAPAAEATAPTSPGDVPAHGASSDTEREREATARKPPFLDFN